LQIDSDGSGGAFVRFREVVAKTLHVAPENGRWKIVSEVAEPSR